MSKQNRRVTIRLTPHQAERLWRLRTDGRYGSEEHPAQATYVLVAGLAALETKPSTPQPRAAGTLDDGSPDPESPLNRLI